MNWTSQLLLVWWSKYQVVVEWIDERQETRILCHCQFSAANGEHPGATFALKVIAYRLDSIHIDHRNSDFRLMNGQRRYAFFMQMRVACEGSWMRKANNWRSCKSASPPLRRPPSADQRLPISKLPSFKPAIRGPEEEAASLKIRQNMIYVNRIEWSSKDGGYQSLIRDFFHALFGSSSSFFSSDFVCVWSSWY